MIDFHPFLISGPEADGKEMTRAVVKVIYEEKKPDVEIFIHKKKKPLQEEQHFLNSSHPFQRSFQTSSNPTLKTG